MTTSAVERVTEQLVSGRRVWIGLFTGEPVAGVLGADSPHCTLLHLGRLAPGTYERGVAEAAVDAAYMVSRRSPALRARVGGVARFASSGDYDPLVLLLQEPRLRALRDWAVETVDAWLHCGRESFSRFDYTPHVTVGRVAAAETAHLERAGGHVDLTHAGVVCGEADWRWRLVG